MDNDNLLSSLEIFSSLGINNDSIQEEIDLEETKSDINLDIEEPHIVFYKNDLIKALNLGIGLIQSKSENIALKSITLIPDKNNKRLYFHTTNDISYFRYSVELLGDNVLTDCISLPLVIIQKLISLMGIRVAIYKKDNLYYIRLIGGDLILDTQTPEAKYLNFPGKVGEKLAEIPVETLGNICKITLPLLSNDIRGENRKLYLTGEEIIYLSNIYYIKAKLKTPKMILKLKDVDYFNRLYKHFKNQNILVFKVEDSSLTRYIFFIDNTMYQTIISESSISELTKEQMDKMLSDIEMIIDFKYLNKLVSLATNLPSSSGKIGFKRNEDNLQACISSASGNSKFVIPVVQYYINKIDKDFKYVNAETLKRLIISLGNVNEVELSINEKSIIIAYNNITAVFMNIN